MRDQNKAREENTPCIIGVDLLGSDIPPSDLLESILSYSGQLKSDVRLILFGTSSLFAGIPPSPHGNILFHVVEEIITMQDAPLTAIRSKRNSSLCIGISLLKKGELHAFISAGNTGALIACAKIVLPELPNVQRPALMTLLPTQKNEIAVLDVGANTTYKSEHLVQFATIGAVYQKSRGTPLPKVGLLNIGSEAKKGTVELQEAYDKLLQLSQAKNPSFAFAGNIEGRDVFHGDIDVLVTDGFTGNVFLKTAEGIAGVILEELNNPLIQECSPATKEIFAEMRQRLHYAEYPGAILCGIDGIVIKCHGNSNAQSLISSITVATRLIHHHFLDHIREALKKN